jgi:hypothetical protein
VYGLSDTKTAANQVIRQMIIALCDEHDYLDTAQEAAEKCNCSLNDAVNKVKHAAGMSLYAHPYLN